MEIEKEIKNSHHFEDNYQKAIVNLIYTYGWVSNELRQRLSKHDITLQQLNILRILRGQHPNPATINLLKDRMLDKMSDASRIVERLVQKDLAKRCTNEKDRRAVDIHITEKGLGILKALDVERPARKVVENNITEAEAEELSRLLDKLRG